MSSWSVTVNDGHINDDTYHDLEIYNKRQAKNVIVRQCRCECNHGMPLQSVIVLTMMFTITLEIVFVIAFVVVVVMASALAFTRTSWNLLNLRKPKNDLIISERIAVTN